MIENIELQKYTLAILLHIKKAIWKNMKKLHKVLNKYKIQLK